ncbi:MAG TPA: DUF4175 family protein [Anaeromyxobacteraceae bacterium]|nr:DUF4175 family protein [Anaeromyxobacteraceae bacterium]
MTSGYAEIARVLAGGRSRIVRILVGAAALRAAAAAVACLLGGALGIVAGARIGFARPVTLLGMAAAVALEAWRSARALRATREPAAVARAITEPGGPLRSDLVSAVELERDRGQIEASRRFSLALLDAHVDRSARSLASVDLVRAVPARPVLRAAGGLGAVAALTLLSVALAPAAVGGGLRRILAGDPAAARLALDPITGDVELTLRYPAYMAREPKTLSGTGGEIRAPKGTEVELKTRADRPVKAAELEVEVAETLTPPPHPASPPQERGRGGVIKVPLAVASERQLSGKLMVEGAGSYRFRFLDGRGRAVAEGPPIPVIVEPDAFPEVRITSPAQEVEVQPGATVKVEWQASDDVGLRDLTLVQKAGGGPERRAPLRKFDGARRDGGAFDLALGPLGLGEGERLLYWLEATDGDAVSGPKKGASGTQVLKIYSEAEHRRKLMELARAAWEELVGVTGDHLELGARGKLHSAELLPLAEALDGRVKRVHGRLREVAAEIRKDKAGPRELAQGLENVAGALRIAEQRVGSARQTLARQVREGRVPEPGLASMTRAFDEQLDAELERGVLYLEQLLDRQQSEDLAKMARDLARSRRELADLLDRYRRAPNEAAKQELVARIARMKERMNDLLRRMAEQAKGLSDEHMNQDALAELAKSKDVAGGLDAVEQALARGDVEAAMKALDQMGSAMDEMVAGLEKTAGMPSEKNRELMKELRDFKRELDGVRADQRRLGEETERLREAWRQRMGERMKEADRVAGRLARLAKEASDAARAAEKGAPRRAQADLENAQEGLDDVQRALAARDLPAALDAARQALGPASRTAMILEEEAQIAERYRAQGRNDAAQAREAQRQAATAVQRADALRRELEGLLPDPQRLLSKEERQRLAQQGQRQRGLDERAGGLQQKLSQLQEKAPIFPPSAQGAIGEARGHMGQASGELQGGNVQRGRAEQSAALEGLDRFAKGLEQMAQGGGGGEGFPLPFGAEGMAMESGEGEEPSPEKVEIPGAEAWRAPAEFRKELLDAMKQGTPERYEGEVKRYYEELVK